MRRPFATALMLLLCAGASACAADNPAQPSGPVLDEAKVLPDPIERALDERLRQYFAASCRAVVVVTVASLEGKPIEAYATDLANRWKIGDPVHGDGVLLVVAPEDRKVRVEVSRSLRAVMPDVAAAEVIQGGMLARYKAGDYPGGITQGVDAIIKRLDASPQANPACPAKKAIAA